MLLCAGEMLILEVYQGTVFQGNDDVLLVVRMNFNLVDPRTHLESGLAVCAPSCLSA